MVAVLMRGWFGRALFNIEHGALFSFKLSSFYNTLTWWKKFNWLVNITYTCFKLSVKCRKELYGSDQCLLMYLVLQYQLLLPAACMTLCQRWLMSCCTGALKHLHWQFQPHQIINSSSFLPLVQWWWQHSARNLISSWGSQVVNFACKFTRGCMSEVWAKLWRSGQVCWWPYPAAFQSRCKAHTDSSGAECGP